MSYNIYYILYKIICINISKLINARHFQDIKHTFSEVHTFYWWVFSQKRLKTAFSYDMTVLRKQQMHLQNKWTKWTLEPHS